VNSTPRRERSKNEWILVNESGLAFFRFKTDEHIIAYSTASSTLKFLDHFQPLLIKQVHSDKIIDIDRSKNRVGDGMITQEKNKVLGIKIADCLPVFLFNEDKVCMIHCGWQGIIKNIARKARKLMGEYEYVLGACIGPCCYEVGYDIAGLFRARHEHAVIERAGKYFVDLKKAVIQDLGAERMIGDLDLCTKCHPEYFYSYRRGDKDKRNYCIRTNIDLIEKTR
jgi:YfiH family protein